MNFRYSISGLPLMAATAMVCLVGSQEAMAQQGGPQARLRASADLMKQGKWQEAYDEIQTAIRVFDKRAPQLGLDFGQYWYVKGLCEMGLQDNKTALESFKTGITKYPTPKNPCIGQSYLKMAEAAIALKDYDQAIGHLKTFIDYRTKTKDLPKSDQDINLGLVYALSAQCNFMSSNTNFDEGIKNIKLIAENRYKGQGIPDDPIIRAFLAMTDKCIQVDKPEIILEFLKTGRAIVALEPWRTADYARQFLALSQKARERYEALKEGGDKSKTQDMLRVTHELLSLAPDQVSVDQSVQGVLARMGNYFQTAADSSVFYDKAFLQALQKRYAEQDKETGQPVGALVLMLTAADYAGAEAARPARAAYTLLNDNYKELQPNFREANMYYLVTMTNVLGEVEEGRRLGNEFGKQYPNSSYNDKVDIMALQTLYGDGKYADALKESAAVMKADPKEPQIRDMALFVQGASLYNLGTRENLKESISVLQQYLDEFPNSFGTPQAMYYVASALKRTASYERAIRAYDKLTAKYPKKGDSPFLPYALFDRAQCNIALDSTSNNEKAMVDLDRLTKEFTDSTLVPVAQLAKGVLLKDKLKKPEEAEAAFKEGMESARKYNDKGAMGEALYRLTLLTKEKKRYEESAVYYDTFWKELADAKEVNPFYRLLEGREGYTVLKSLNRTQEGMDRFEKTIVSVSRQSVSEDQSDLEKAINSYTTEYLSEIVGKDKAAKLNLEEIKKHYYNFPGVTSDDANLITMLRIALVGIYEGEVKKHDKSDTAGIASLEAQIQVIFQDIQKSLKIEHMTPYALITLGTYLGEKTDHPETAIPYFEEIIKRGNNKYVSDAQFGLAQAYSRSKDPAEVAKAVQMMNKLLDDERGKSKPDPSILLKAGYYEIKFAFNTGDYNKAINLAKKYLDDNRSEQNYSPEIAMLWAQSFDKLGDIDKAIVGYSRVNDNYKGRIEFSASAVQKIMELYYQRNRPKPGPDKPSDKLLAYDTGRLYINVTKGLLDKMSVSDRSVWRDLESLVEKYAQDPEISVESKAAEERTKAKADSLKL